MRRKTRGSRRPLSYSIYTFAASAAVPSFLLECPTQNRRGLLHENDVASLAGFGKLLSQTFDKNLAPHAPDASPIRIGLSMCQATTATLSACARIFAKARELARFRY